MTETASVFGWLLTRTAEEPQILILVHNNHGWVFQVFRDPGGGPRMGSSPLTRYVRDNAESALTDVQIRTNLLGTQGYTEYEGPHPITVSGLNLWDSPKLETSIAGAWLRNHHPFFRTTAHP